MTLPNSNKLVREFSTRLTNRATDDLHSLRLLWFASSWKTGVSVKAVQRIAQENLPTANLYFPQKGVFDVQKSTEMLITAHCRVKNFERLIDI